MAKHEIVVLRDRLGDHPAVRAWGEVENGAGPISVEVLKSSNKTAVCRLNGVGPAKAIVAKRGERDVLDFERLLYTEVLPSLSLPSLEVYGCADAEGERGWMFLEDAGERWYDPADSAHLALAVGWLGDLHTRSSGWVRLMPDTGPRYFRAVADTAIEGLGTGLDHPALSTEGGSVLRALIAHVEAVREGWDEIEAACALAPLGLVHGDFMPKNVRVREGGGGPELVVFDWEKAGAAPPAADLAKLPEEDGWLHRYHEHVSDAWPDLCWDDLEALARTGRLLRLLHAVSWEVQSFKHAWIERAMRKMGYYEQGLREAIESGVAGSR